MQRILTGLAVLAGCGAAMAQSSVSIYGRIDVPLAVEKINGVTTRSIASGLLSTSRLGFRGTEDLGGGLKANFNLEAQLFADDGRLGSGGMTFDRQSWVGLSGGFGAVKLGRTDTAFDDVRDIAVANNLWDSEFSPTKIAYGAGAGDYSSRASNMVRYDSPSFGGFGAGVSYSVDEQPGPVARDVQAAYLRYRQGALDVGVGYQHQKHEATPGSDRKYLALSGAYKFQAFRVSGGYQRARNGAGVRDDEYSVGVAVPLGAFEVSAGYARSESDNSSAEGSAWALGATYAMSKRTRLYAGLLDGEVKDGAGAVATDRRLLALGVRHDF